MICGGREVRVLHPESWNSALGLDRPEWPKSLAYGLMWSLAKLANPYIVCFAVEPRFRKYWQGHQ